MSEEIEKDMEGEKEEDKEEEEKEEDKEEEEEDEKEKDEEMDDSESESEFSNPDNVVNYLGNNLEQELNKGNLYNSIVDQESDPNLSENQYKEHIDGIGVDSDNDEDDDDDDEDDDYLQKLENKDFIIENHPEILNINYNAINKLCTVVRDDDNNIIDPQHKTVPILTKYEKTRILGVRSKQLNNGAQPFISVNENIIDGLIIANLELQEKKIPYIIKRPISGNNFEYWKLEDLEII